MSKNVDVEILVPVYNCKIYIDQCINSIQKQTLNGKIIMMDDGSMDSVQNHLMKYKSPNNTVLFSSKNRGNLATINTLLSQSKSRYIAFQDADDWSEKERLATQIDFMEREGLDFCFTNFIKSTINGDYLYCGYYQDNLITSTNIGDIEPSICFASILFKREVYEKIGGFDNYFNRIGGADIDWLYRAFAAGFKGGIVKAPLYFYRDNDHSYTSTVSLDSRKYISLEIARYLYKYRISKGANPSKVDLNRFISKQLIKINFDVKANLKDFIVQAISRQQYLTASGLLFKYFLTKPLGLKDLKLVKYFLYKIRDAK